MPDTYSIALRINNNQAVTAARQAAAAAKLVERAWRDAAQARAAYDNYRPPGATGPGGLPRAPHPAGGVAAGADPLRAARKEAQALGVIQQAVLAGALARGQAAAAEARSGGSAAAAAIATQAAVAAAFQKTSRAKVNAAAAEAGAARRLSAEQVRASNDGARAAGRAALARAQAARQEVSALGGTGAVARNTNAEVNRQLRHAQRVAAEHGVSTRVMTRDQAERLYAHMGPGAVSSVQGSYHAKDDRIDINPHAQGWWDPGYRARKAASGFHSSAHEDHLIHHELGHALHRRNLGYEGYHAVKAKQYSEAQREYIAKHVSRYAGTNPAETVAEMYAGMAAGKDYGPKLMGHYRSLGGVLPARLRDEVSALADEDRAPFVARHPGPTVDASRKRLSDDIEEHVARLVGGRKLAGNEPWDVEKPKPGGGFHRIEVKSKHFAAAKSLSVQPGAFLKKVLHKLTHPKDTWHTVLTDVRDRSEGGAHADAYSGNELYYKRAAGRYSVGNMLPVRDKEHLNRLIDMPPSKLPEAARGAFPEGEALEELKAKAARDDAYNKARRSSRGEKAAAEGRSLYAGRAPRPPAGEISALEGDEHDEYLARIARQDEMVRQARERMRAEQEAKARELDKGSKARVKKALAAEGPGSIRRAKALAAAHGVKAEILDRKRAEELYGKEGPLGVFNTPADYDPHTGTVRLNPFSPGWDDPASMQKRRAAERMFASEHPDAVIHHEIGHAKHLGKLDPAQAAVVGKFQVPADIRRLAKKHVGEYATVNNAELVAEMFSGMAAGKKYPKRLTEYYKSLGGEPPGADLSALEGDEGYARGAPERLAAAHAIRAERSAARSGYAAGGRGRKGAAAAGGPGGEEPHVDVGLHKLQIDTLKLTEKRAKENAAAAADEVARAKKVAAERQAIFDKANTDEHNRELKAAKDRERRAAKELEAAQKAAAGRQAIFDRAATAEHDRQLKEAKQAEKDAARAAELAKKAAAERQRIFDKAGADEHNRLLREAQQAQKQAEANLKAEEKRLKRLADQRERAEAGPAARAAEHRRRTLTEEQAQALATNKIVDVQNKKRVEAIAKERGVRRLSFAEAVHSALDLESALGKAAVTGMGLVAVKVVATEMASAFFAAAKNAEEMGKKALDVMKDLRQVSSVEGKVNDREFMLDVARFGAQTGLGVQGAASFREAFGGRANIVKGVTIGDRRGPKGEESEFEKYRREAGRITSIKGLDVEDAGDLFGNILKMEDFTKKDPRTGKVKGADTATARALSTLEILDAGSGMMKKLIPEFNKLTAVLQSEEDLEGVIRTPGEAAVITSVLAEAGEGDIATKARRMSEGLRDFGKAKKLPFQKRAGLKPEDSLLEMMNKVVAALEEDVAKGIPIDQAIKNAGFDKEKINVQALATVFKARKKVLKPQQERLAAAEAPGGVEAARERLRAAGDTDVQKQAEARGMDQLLEAEEGGGTAAVVARERAANRLRKDKVFTSFSPRMAGFFSSMATGFQVSGRDVQIEEEALRFEKQRVLGNRRTTAAQRAEAAAAEPFLGASALTDNAKLFEVLDRIARSNEAMERKEAAAAAAKAAAPRPVPAAAPVDGPARVPARM